MGGHGALLGSARERLARRNSSSCLAINERLIDGVPFERSPGVSRSCIFSRSAQIGKGSMRNFCTESHDLYRCERVESESRDPSVDQLRSSPFQTYPEDGRVFDSFLDPLGWCVKKKK